MRRRWEAGSSRRVGWLEYHSLVPRWRIAIFWHTIRGHRPQWTRTEIGWTVKCAVDCERGGYWSWMVR